MTVQAALTPPTSLCGVIKHTERDIFPTVAQDVLMLMSYWVLVRIRESPIDYP